MSAHIPTDLAREVRHRANDCCEYCRLPQEFQEATFHIDHIVPRINGGATVLPNLALACVSCSLRKAARREAYDSQTGEAAKLFHPRLDLWNDHFAMTEQSSLLGLSPIGRATIKALAMNRPAIIAIRHELVASGRFPI